MYVWRSGDTSAAWMLRAAVLTKVSRRERFNDVLLVEVSIKRSPLLLENVGMPQSVLSLPSGLS